MSPIELINARKALALSQVALAERLEVSREYISRRENGHYPIEKTTELAVRYLLERV